MNWSEKNPPTLELILCSVCLYILLCVYKLFVMPYVIDLVVRCNCGLWRPRWPRRGWLMNGRKKWRYDKWHKTTVTDKNSYQFVFFCPLKLPHWMPREWTGASTMRSCRLAASALTRSFRNYNVGSDVRGHICPAFARTLERHCSYKTRNGEVLKQESDCSELRQKARHENSSDFKT